MRDVVTESSNSLLAVFQLPGALSSSSLRSEICCFATFRSVMSRIVL